MGADDDCKQQQRHGLGPATSQALADVLQTGAFHDAAQVCASREGCEPEDTHVRVGQTPSRIDQVYVNNIALAALRDVRVL